MLKKILASLAIAMIVSSSMAFAGPAAERATLDSFVREVHESTGKSEEEIRREAIEALRREGGYSEEDLTRVGRARAELDPARQSEMVGRLRRNQAFRARVGLSGARNANVERSAGEAFEGTAENAAPVRSERLTPAQRNSKVFLDVSRALSEAAATAMETVAPEHHAKMQRFSLILVKRVKRGALAKGVAEQMVLDVAKSPEKLGELIIGEGATQACMEMDPRAVENLGDAINGGVRGEGRDAEGVVRGMGKRFSEKFHQELEEGIARVCALASSGCRLFSKPIMDACAKINHRAL